MPHLAFRTTDEDVHRLEALRRSLPLRVSRSAIARECVRRGAAVIEAELSEAERPPEPPDPEPPVPARLGG